MLVPEKHMNLELSTIRVTSILIELLKKNKIISYDFTLKYLESILGKKAKYIFIDSLNVLFLMGKIEYDIKKDSIKFIEK